jgi:hypothetical protein
LLRQIKVVSRTQTFYNWLRQSKLIHELLWKTPFKTTLSKTAINILYSASFNLQRFETSRQADKITSNDMTCHMLHRFHLRYEWV